ncbi:hypothetical protein MMPV_007899 [Pyropia vietnamensis]
MRRGGGGGGGGGGGSGMRDRRGERTISLHVRGYDQARTTAEALRARFLKFGHILDVYMPRDYYTKKPRGFCYIEFENDAEAEKAKEDTDRTDLFRDGNVVNVMWAAGSRKRPEQMRALEHRDASRSRSRSPLMGSRGRLGPGFGGGGGRRSRSWGPPYGHGWFPSDGWAPDALADALTLALAQPFAFSVASWSPFSPVAPADTSAPVGCCWQRVAITVPAIAVTTVPLACVALAFVSVAVAALAVSTVPLSALTLATLAFPVAAFAVSLVALAAFPLATLSVASVAEPQPDACVGMRWIASGLAPAAAHRLRGLPSGVGFTGRGMGGMVRRKEVTLLAGGGRER